MWNKYAISKHSVQQSLWINACLQPLMVFTNQNIKFYNQNTIHYGCFKKKGAEIQILLYIKLPDWTPYDAHKFYSTDIALNSNNFSVNWVWETIKLFSTQYFGLCGLKEWVHVSRTFTIA